MRIAIIFVLLLSPLASKAIFLWPDWFADTPGGNMISNNWGPTSLLTKDSIVLEELSEWYFYKNHVIGSCAPFAVETPTKYFIFNENSNTLRTFKLEKDWQNQLQKSNLKPSIWTRWYTDDWDSFSMQDLGLILLLLLVFRIALSFEMVKKKLNANSLRTPIIIGIILLIMIFKWKLSNPGSL